MLFYEDYFLVFLILYMNLYATCHYAVFDRALVHIMWDYVYIYIYMCVYFAIMFPCVPLC